ncbi:hypothetical protein [Nocardia xishanensis]
MAARLGGGARAATVGEAVAGVDAVLLAVAWRGRHPGQRRIRHGSTRGDDADRPDQCCRSRGRCADHAARRLECATRGRTRAGCARGQGIPPVPRRAVG